MMTRLTMIVAAAALPLVGCASTDEKFNRAAVGAGVGASAGAGVAAVLGQEVLLGAAIGAAVGGLAGAVWADNDRDGRTDGYVHNGQYYPGAPK